MPKTTVAKSSTWSADQSAEPGHDYLEYWSKRQYEHRSEVLALKRLLKGKHFKTAVDIGGGHGRLSPLLKRYADKVILAEPSQQRLDAAEYFLKDHSDIERRLMYAHDLHLEDESVDLAILIRVTHYLVDPDAEFREIARILKPHGSAVIEVANYLHARNRLKHLLKRERMPVKPVSIPASTDDEANNITFVNHNPHTIVRQLEHAGLQVEAALSVSNLRSRQLKRIVPPPLMILTERLAQRPLAHLYFGPSIFFLVSRSPSEH